jgi:lipopolysaccharide biosynthesis glycosyltransferase
MKFVYVLSSSEKDFYYEQFLLSAASMRHFNPDAEIIALFDKTTKQSLTGKRSAYQNYITKEIVVDVGEGFSQKEASRILKTTIPAYVDGDFLFIDCDTIICEKLDVHFPQEITIGAVPDCHTALAENHNRDAFLEANKKLGFEAPFKNAQYYNGGLIYFHESPAARDFFAKWNELWLYSREHGSSQDMPPLNEANYRLGGRVGGMITELPGEWNCQISHNGLPFLSEAKIIHYYATSLSTQESPYIFASENTFRSIKDSGCIPGEVTAALGNPLAAFVPFTRIVAGSTADVVNSNIFAKFLWLYKHHKKLFYLLNSFMLKFKNKKRG